MARFPMMACKALFVGALCFGTASGAPCRDTDTSTQTDLNLCAKERADEADRELNAAYKELKTRYSDDTLFLAKLKKAQRAWIAYRDLELKLVDSEGSIAPLCVANRLAELNAERAKYLKSLAEAEEGDVCAP